MPTPHMRPHRCMPRLPAQLSHHQVVSSHLHLLTETPEVQPPTADRLSIDYETDKETDRETDRETEEGTHTRDIKTHADCKCVMSCRRVHSEHQTGVKCWEITRQQAVLLRVKPWCKLLLCTPRQGRTTALHHHRDHVLCNRQLLPHASTPPCGLIAG